MEATRGFLVLACCMRRGLVVGVRVENDVITAQFGNFRHLAIVRRSPAVRTGFSGPLGRRWAVDIRSSARTPRSTWDTQLSERPISPANST